MIKTILKPSIFWGIVLSALFAIMLLILFLSKQDSFLALQAPHNKFNNILFLGITFIGDGVFLMCVVLILAIYLSYRYAIILLGAYILGSLTVQLIKQIVIPHNPRPVKWFELNQIQLYVPSDLTPYSWFSFPSGHSASAASLAFCMVLIFHKSWQQVLIALTLLLVGYSRIYRYMHFPEDVLGGFFIGFIAAIASLYIFTYFFSSRNMTWVDNRIVKK
jgi:membrane-associated phospholipid phosphatase